MPELAPETPITVPSPFATRPRSRRRPRCHPS
jgi:hypothetical protein